MADTIHTGVDYHCLFVRAMLPYRGHTLRTGQIVSICDASGFEPLSVCLPNDHASGNDDPWCEMQCHQSKFQVFDQVKRGVYKVRSMLYWCDGTIA